MGTFGFRWLKVLSKFGFGGIARIGEGDLPSDNILGEHVRLGSQSVILSRTFKGVVGVDKNGNSLFWIQHAQLASSVNLLRIIPIRSEIAPTDGTTIGIYLFETNISATTINISAKRNAKSVPIANLNKLL